MSSYRASRDCWIPVPAIRTSQSVPSSSLPGSLEIDGAHVPGGITVSSFSSIALKLKCNSTGRKLKLRTICRMQK